mgnify:CR=1 FL=1
MFVTDCSRAWERCAVTGTRVRLRDRSRVRPHRSTAGVSERHKCRQCRALLNRMRRSRESCSIASGEAASYVVLHHSHPDLPNRALTESLLRAKGHFALRGGIFSLSVSGIETSNIE